LWESPARSSCREWDSPALSGKIGIRCRQARIAIPGAGWLSSLRHPKVRHMGLSGALLDCSAHHLSDTAQSFLAVMRRIAADPVFVPAAQMP
jgi:hypothetical protein